MNTRNDKVALVTGASRGIGAAVATRLAQDGFALIVNYAGDRGGADEVVKQITDGGGRAIAVQADVSDAAAVKRLFETAEAKLGGVDVLVNNAGVMSLAPIAETNDEDFDRMVSINLKGTFNTLREAATRLRKGGRIINFSSTVIGLQLPGYAAYAATKAGVEAFTSVFAKELRGREITVNSVAPGPIATDLYLKGKSEEQVQKASKHPPLERLGVPSDVANVVSFLTGNDGAWVNGQSIRINGGTI